MYWAKFRIVSSIWTKRNHSLQEFWTIDEEPSAYLAQSVLPRPEFPLHPFLQSCGEQNLNTSQPGLGIYTHASRNLIELFLPSGVVRSTGYRTDENEERKWPSLMSETGTHGNRQSPFHHWPAQWGVEASEQRPLPLAAALSLHPREPGLIPPGFGKPSRASVKLPCAQALAVLFQSGRWGKGKVSNKKQDVSACNKKHPQVKRIVLGSGDLPLP